ncbi:hypothetical protein ACW4TU_45335 (plasmid) [Streptomyces sp. QTS52]
MAELGALVPGAVLGLDGQGVEGLAYGQGHGVAGGGGVRGGGGEQGGECGERGGSAGGMGAGGAHEGFLSEITDSG